MDTDVLRERVSEQIDNQSVSKILDDLYNKVDQVGSREELINLLQVYINKGMSLRYENGLCLTTGYLFFALSIITLSAQYLLHGSGSLFTYILAFIFIIPTTLCILVVYGRGKRIDRVSQKIARKELFLANGIQVDTSPRRKALTTLKKRFAEFKRGDRLRITEMYLIAGDKRKLRMLFLQIDNKRKEKKQTRDLNGNIKTVNKNVIDRHFRSTILVDEVSGCRISIESSPVQMPKDYVVCHPPGNEDFQDRYRVSAKNDYQAYSFLQPHVLQGIVDLGKILNGLNIEVDDKGTLCLSLYRSR